MNTMTNTIRMTEAWEKNAHALFVRWFPNLDIKQPQIDAELWHSAYVICFAANEIARCRGERVTVTLIETEDEFFPAFAVSNPETGRQLNEMYTAFAADVPGVGREILNCLRHPEPGTEAPDHSKRSGILDRTLYDSKIPMPGEDGSLEYLADLLRRQRAGDVTADELEEFERHYGASADRELQNACPPLPAFDADLAMDDVDLEDVMHDDAPAMPCAEAARRALEGVSRMISRRPVIA
ncbi:hypothetical protein SAMN05444340_12116 [Citreimonas salinaria]|uniref:Uncharacterized protein n=2 Tax=Citreimonas salinaria TaxID=321339 RepID=A0A1H3N909_9RHOB|nr:hypothetical protein SAMN05444340_12116 [Citreimonas salinaria]